LTYWQFEKLGPNHNSGTSTVEDNFANEERTSVEILVRETLQNPLDARHLDDLVEVRYNLISVNRHTSAFAKALFSDECCEHLLAGKLTTSEKLPDTIVFLVVEDFGTSGLEGSFTDSSVDGSSENWNAFWFREGQGAKPTKSNGGAGQGKITLYTTSTIRTVLALTRRVSDDKELLLGCCRFRQNYKLPDNNKDRWSKEGRWSSTKTPGDLAIPIQDALFLEMLKEELQLRRGARPGTTFIVPMPIDISLTAIQNAVVNEFYFPVRRGRLKVEVGEVVIDSESISKVAAELGNAGRHSSDFRAFMEQAIKSHIDSVPMATAKRNWMRESKLSDIYFESAKLKAVKAAFESSEPVDVEFPVQITKKGSTEILSGAFRVILKQNLDAEQSHELFIRQDLGIDGEGRLKGSRRIQPCLALTFIQESNLSSLLAAAEEPTHRKWNSTRPKVVAQYKDPDKALKAVRNAALRLVEFLTPPGKRDDTALSIYFADPTAPPAKRKGGAGIKPDSPTADPDVDLPPIPSPSVKPIDFVPLSNGFRIKSNPPEMMLKSLPLLCEIDVAYATTFGDPFTQWDAAEFWLNDDKAFPIDSSGITELVRDGNQISFSMTHPVSGIMVTGFDVNRQLEVRINYRESKNAADI
jgi:hypothetical protein